LQQDQGDEKEETDPEYSRNMRRRFQCRLDAKIVGEQNQDVQSQQAGAEHNGCRFLQVVAGEASQVSGAVANAAVAYDGLDQPTDGEDVDQTQNDNDDDTCRWTKYRRFLARLCCVPGARRQISRNAAARNLRHETYGTVAVFEDLYGNQWDLLQLAGRER